MATVAALTHVAAGCTGFAHGRCLAATNTSSRGATNTRRHFHLAPDRDFLEVHEFDPRDVPNGAERLDVDVNRWAQFSGTWPRSHLNNRNNAWKMDPNRDLSDLEFHFTKGIPSPPGVIMRCQGIASRNARELAEQLGRDYGSEPWPTVDGVIYLPRLNHKDPDVDLHIDMLPYGNGVKARQLPVGNTSANVTPAEAEEVEDDEDAQAVVALRRKRVKRRRGRKKK